jgi:3-hydroxyacyl-CoA dehydrogenase
MLIRFQDCEEKATDPVLQSFQVISLAKTAASAHDAQSIGYLKQSDKITMNRDRLLFDAKETALDLANNYAPPKPREDIHLPGPAGKAALMDVFTEMKNSGKTTPYDAVVLDALTTVLSGGAETDRTKEMSEQDILDLEYNAFVTLVQNEGTKDRVEHMLKTGRPLRN